MSSGECRLNDDDLLGRAVALTWMEQCAVAESIAGNLKTHVFYATPSARAGDAVAQADGPATVPLWRDSEGPALAKRLSNSRRMNVEFDVEVIDGMSTAKGHAIRLLQRPAPKRIYSRPPFKTYATRRTACSPGSKLRL